MKNTIRWRIILPFILLLVLAMSAVSFYFITLFHQTYVDQLKSDLRAEARLVGNVLEPWLVGTNSSTGLEPVVQQYANQLSVRITLIRPDGVVLADSQADPSRMDNHRNRPEVQQALQGLEATDIRYSDTLKANYLYAAVPIQMNGQVVGVSRLAVSLANVNDVPDRIRNTGLIVTLLASLLALALAALSTRFALKPLKNLTQTVQHIAEGEFVLPALPETHDEVGQLNQAFIRMTGELHAKIEALQTEREKLAAVLTNMTDGVAIVDADGIVQLINPAATHFFQVPQNLGVGHSVVEVLRHHQLVDMWQTCLKSGEPQALTLELPAERLFLQTVATCLEKAPQSSVLLVFQDLTRLRRLETVRQDFVSNVSHELRTPLAALKALTETLQEGALEDPPMARRFLAKMETEIDTLTQMVQELLELSRIESGKVPLQRQRIEPCAFLEPVVERMRLQAERAGLTLRLDCPNDLPRISADPERLQQVLINLLHNAIKFTPPTGSVTVLARRGTGEVIFEIRDSGVGIPPKDLARIFERFYKADRARSGGGTGLGLSIARHIVEAHGGRIWAESEVNHGSTFYFALPVTA